MPNEFPNEIWIFPVTDLNEFTPDYAATKKPGFGGSVKFLKADLFTEMREALEDILSRKDNKMVPYEKYAKEKARAILAKTAQDKGGAV